MSTHVTPNPGRCFLQYPLRVYQALFISDQVATSSSGYETGTGKIEQHEFSPQHSKTTADPFSVHIGSSSFFNASIRLLCLVSRMLCLFPCILELGKVGIQEVALSSSSPPSPCSVCSSTREATSLLWSELDTGVQVGLVCELLNLRLGEAVSQVMVPSRGSFEIGKDGSS